MRNDSRRDHNHSDAVADGGSRRVAIHFTQSFEFLQAFYDGGWPGRLSKTEFAVLFAYVKHAEAKTGIAWPSAEMIASQYLGLAAGRGQVMQARASLVKYGLLERLPQRSSAAPYRVMMPSNSRVCAAETTALSIRQRCEIDSASAAESTAPALRIPPPEERQEERQGSETVSATFVDDIYKAFGPKRKDERPRAAKLAIIRAIKRISIGRKTSLIEAASWLIDRVKPYSRQRSREIQLDPDQAKYTPLCATWMNQGRYEAEVNEDEASSISRIAITPDDAPLRLPTEAEAVDLVKNLFPDRKEAA